VPKKILGIDIGSSSIKLVQLSKNFRGISTVKYIEKPIPHIETEETADQELSKQEVDISKILKDAIEQNLLISDEYISSIPSKFAMVRETNLPFKEAVKIRQIIKFEIEQSLPFPPEETLVDFLTNGTDSGSSNVTAFCVHKRNLSNHLSVLNAAGVEPKLITIDSFPVLSTLKSSLVSLYGIICHIEIGAKNTVINIFKDGNFLFNRTIPKAGNFLTTKLREHFKLSFEEAENLKKDPDVDITAAEPSEATQVILKAFEKIASEISYSLNSFLARKSKYSIDKIYLSGGTSCIKGIGTFLHNRLNAEIQLLIPKLSSDTQKNGNLSHLNYSVFPIAFGLTNLETDDKLKRINLRREEYVFKFIDKRIKTNIKYASALAAAIIILSIFNLAFDLFQKKTKNKELEDKIASVYHEMVPSGKVVNAAAQAEQQIGKINEEFEKFRQVMEIKSTPLEVMRELSTIIPKDFKVKILDFSFREKKLEIRGEADNLESVDKLEKILKSSSLFKDIKISNIQMNQIQNIAEFTLDINLN